MKRPHRSIETFDISLMAVVTKAMGAFLVLMLLLMPYYQSGPIGQQEVQDLAKKVAEVDHKVKQAMEKLAGAAPEDLRQELAEALKLLEEARKLNANLERVIDALNSQVKRLEQEKAELESQVAQLQKQVAALQAQVAELQKENAALKSQVAQLQQENAALKSQVAQLQQENAALKQQVAQLQQENASLKQRNAELERIVEVLRGENQQLKAENAELKRVVDPLKAENAELKRIVDPLKAENAELKRQVDPLKARVAALEQENEALKRQIQEMAAQNRDMQERLSKYRGAVITGQVVNPDCRDVVISIGVFRENLTLPLPDKTSTAYVIHTGGLGRYYYATGGAFFDYRGVPPNRYPIVIEARAPSQTEMLKPIATAGCKVWVSFQYGPDPDNVSVVNPQPVVLSQGSYAKVLLEAEVTPEAVKLVDPSPSSQRWLADQIEHAQKER